MPSVPVPFVVTLLLLILLVQITRRGTEVSVGRPVVVLITICAVQSVLIGLRWGYDVPAVLWVTPVLAAAVPPLVFVSFEALARADAERHGQWLHALPPILLGLLVLVWRSAVDFALIGLYVGYALALLRLAARGPDGLGCASFERVVPAHRALQVASAMLLVAATVDALVVLDVEWARGEHAAAIVGFATVLQLLVLGYAAATAGPTPPSTETIEPAPATTIDRDEDLEVIARIDDLLRAQGLFRDTELTLSRLARRAGLPARRLSAAVNRVHAKNVSHYINGFRIAEACRRLTETDQPVSRIMIDVGFLTKSNFNREFRRITNMSPLTWRARGSGAPED